MDDNYTDVEPPMMGSGGKNMIENYPDLVQWFNDPEAKNIDKRFTKDLVLSNLNEREIGILRNFLELTREMGMYDCLRRAKMHFLATAFDIPILANSKNGFARRWSHTGRVEQSYERKEEPMASGGAFGKRRR